MGLIEGIGTALPAHGITQDSAAELAQSVSCRSRSESRALSIVYRRARVRQRSIVLLKSEDDIETARKFFMPDIQGRVGGPSTAERMARYRLEAPPLAAGAAHGALTDADVAVGEISHLVTVSCTGFASPGLDVELIDRLGLLPSVARTNVGFMGCHGVFNGMRVAAAFAQAERGRTLLCATELCSLHLQSDWGSDNVVSGSLFADGAAAMIVGSAAPNGRDGWRIQASGSHLIPGTRDAMTWHVGDHGFRMTLSPDVPRILRARLKPWLIDWLGDSGLNLSDVKAWAVHPGGPRILDEVENALGLDDTALNVSRDVLTEHGNMSSPTVLFILDRLRQRQITRPCVALGFGPGLVVEAALLV